MTDGINKLVAIKKETTWGTKASASGARLYPRTTGNFQIEKDTYASNSIRPSQQLSDSRHGTVRATGSLNDDLQCGAFDELMAAALRRDFDGGATTGSITDLTVSASAPNFTRGTGSFVTDGFEVGQIIKPASLTATADNSFAIVTSVTALQMNAAKVDKVAYTAESAGASVSIAQTGFETYTPQTGHTDDSFTVEEWHSAISLSSITLGQQVNSMNISVSPNSMATISFEFMGKNGEATTGTRYFTSPTAVAGEGSMSAPSGLLLINGVSSCRLTSFNCTVANNITQESVIACTGIGAKSRGKVMVSGSFSAILDDGVFQDYFYNESEIEFSYAFTAADGEVFNLYFPRMKIGATTTDDGEKVIIITSNFEALEYTTTTAGKVNTTLMISDSTLS